MIKKITLDQVASYKSSKNLETDKKTNLIYGLNGTGKSTISNFLYDQNDLNYDKCCIEGLEGNDEILVYNQRFILENFYESESQDGIFTLSKSNQEAEQKIQKAREEKNSLKDKFEANNLSRNEIASERDEVTKEVENKVWEVKTEYTGGDRVFEYCFNKLKSSRSKLFEHLSQINKPEQKPSKSLENLKKEIQSITGDDAKKIDYSPKINFGSSNIESNDLVSKVIVGSDNSSVGEFITKLGNSDWVKNGLSFLPEEINKKEKCPFCQEETITKDLMLKLKGYFDETYQKDISNLKDLEKAYRNSIASIPDLSKYEENPKHEKYKKEFNSKFKALEATLSKNITLLEEKINSPSQSLHLEDTSKLVTDLDFIIDSINKNTKVHNDKIDNIEKSLTDLKIEFWDIIRWEYDQTISTYSKSYKILNDKINTIDQLNSELSKLIKAENDIIITQQKLTVNIDEAIENINQGLLDLGIEDFKIVKYSDNLYKVIRKESDDTIFKSLSEGEKMIISFLYFIEMCRGKKRIEEGDKNKIIVIDDPISSLSHIYVFNIGRLIHQEFLRNDKYEQVFVLTHSLYFFYELTDKNKDRRKENQKLFRLRKNQDGSEILEMKYEEIQNDYQSYWQVVKDENQSPALIANCMRNIIEYFFNFVEKKDLNNVFQKPVMQENRFQSFNRYINRESHSLGQNIFDIKEFNYSDFKDAFRLVFVKNSYEEHYKRMMK
ncbi:MAG: AAA family ATPase [Salegentibacter mishustinae]|nr:AAA family ATPase [Salegentibacter mishustinae]